MCGKYENINIFKLPEESKPSINNKVSNPTDKICDMNNFTYIDSFFAYLSGTLKEKYGFIHGLNFFGSFLAIKNNYKINIADDFELLCKSDFFNSNINELFTLDNFDHEVYNNYTHNYINILLIETFKNNEIIFKFDYLNKYYDAVFESNKKVEEIKTM